MNELLAELERLEADGAVIALKWDGGRRDKKRSVIVSKPGAEYFFREDTDDLASAIARAVRDYDEKFC